MHQLFINILITVLIKYSNHNNAILEIKLYIISMYMVNIIIEDVKNYSILLKCLLIPL